MPPAGSPSLRTSRTPWPASALERGQRTESGLRPAGAGSLVAGRQDLGGHARRDPVEKPTSVPSRLRIPRWSACASRAGPGACRAGRSGTAARGLSPGPPLGVQLLVPAQQIPHLDIVRLPFSAPVPFTPCLRRHLLEGRSAAPREPARPCHRKVLADDSGDHCGLSRRTGRTDPEEQIMAKAYLVGSGIAALSAAAFLIRDGGFDGPDIHLLEEQDRDGGSLDAAGTPETGYTMRGGRMFELQFRCTYDLLSSIPSLDDPSMSVTEDTFGLPRRLRLGRPRPPRRRGRQDRRRLARWDSPNATAWSWSSASPRPRTQLDGKRITDCFSDDFFTTNFWFMWCTTFAFEPWHSAIEFRRYLNRFVHLFPTFDTMSGIYRTRYNQYDSIVRPLPDLAGRPGRQSSAPAAGSPTSASRGATGTTVDRILLVPRRTRRAHSGGPGRPGPGHQRVHDRRLQPGIRRPPRPSPPRSARPGPGSCGSGWPADATTSATRTPSTGTSRTPPGSPSPSPPRTRSSPNCWRSSAAVRRGAADC